MLKLDKSADLERPLLFHDGMVYGDEDLLTPVWENGDGKTDSWGSQSYLSVNRYPLSRCRNKGMDVPENGWLCSCGNATEKKTGGRTERPRRISVLCASRSGRRSSSGDRWTMRRREEVSR